MAAEPIRAPLLAWYRKAKRDLPWRRTKDPYAIWVSEAMLQQTTVAAVIPYWEKFLARFPTVRSLAASREHDVLALWSGLGYYRRARALRAGAIAVMRRHGGRVPEEIGALMELPGVGRYTAGAIASLAFGKQAPVVDGNVKRVFSRLYARNGSEPEYWSIAETLVRGRSPGGWNQALMELGATVCTPREPSCDVCPVKRWCKARALGRIEEFPPRKKQPAARNVPVAVSWIARNDRVLLEKRHPEGPLRGAWDLPAAVVPRGVGAGRAIAKALAERHGFKVESRGLMTSARHSILSSRLTIDVVEARPAATVPRTAALRWVPIAGLSAVPISGATSKIVRAVLAQGTSSSRSSSSGSRGRLNL